MFKIKQKLLKSNCPTYIQFKRFISDVNANYKLLANYFEINPSKAQRYLTKHKLNKLDPDRFQRVVTFCNEHGFSKEDIFKTPNIFHVHPVSLDQRYTVLMEGGFTNVTLLNISKFRSLIGTRIQALKNLGLIHPSTDVAKSFIRFLTPQPKYFSVKSANDLDTWSEIHMKVLVSYLSWRLSATTNDITRMIAVQKEILRKSFQYLCQNIATAEKLGFTHEKIVKNGYILRAYPKYVDELFTLFPQLCGIDIASAIKMFPKIMTAPPQNIQEVYNLLKGRGITDYVIAKHLNVLYLSPKTVKFRLDELNKIADFKVLLHNPNILQIVVHHNRAKSRLTFLKSLQLKCAPLTVLGTDNDKFDNYIKEGKDTNTYNDIFSFLKGTFNRKAEEFDHILRKHPYYLLVPLLTMEETYSFLRFENFSNEDIFNLIFILLYDKEKVQQGLVKARKYEKQNHAKLTPLNILNLTLYYMEKDNHFTGDGIWLRSEFEDEPELTQSS